MPEKRLKLLSFIVSRGGYFVPADIKAMQNLSDYFTEVMVDDLLGRGLVKRRMIGRRRYYQVSLKGAKLVGASEYSARYSDEKAKALKGLARLKLGVRYRDALLTPEEVSWYLRSTSTIMIDKRITVDVVRVTKGECVERILYVYVPESAGQMTNAVMNTLVALEFADEIMTVCFYTHPENVVALSQYLASSVEGFGTTGATSNPSEIDNANLTNRQKLNLALYGSIEKPGLADAASVPNKTETDQSTLTYTQRLRLELSGSIDKPNSNVSPIRSNKKIEIKEKTQYKSTILPVDVVDF